MNKILAGRTTSNHSRGDILSKRCPMHGFVERLFSLKRLSLVFALAQKTLNWVQQSLSHALWCQVCISILSDRQVPFYLFIFNSDAYWCLQNKAYR